MKLANAINAYQKDYSLTDAELARLWGVNQTTILRLKTGERKVGNKVRRGCRQFTPDFYPILLECSEDMLPASHQTHYKGRQGGLTQRLVVWVKGIIKGA